MTILSKQKVIELQRIIKEATGRDISFGDSHLALHFLIRLSQLIWDEEPTRRRRHGSDQPSLFD
jgi:hypothetical protein